MKKWQSLKYILLLCMWKMGVLRVHRTLIQGWTVIQFFYLQVERLYMVDTHLILDA